MGPAGLVAACPMSAKEADILRRWRVRSLIAASTALLALTGRGSGVEVMVVDAPPVAPLGLQFTRVGVEALRLDWSFDPAVLAYCVTRDGVGLASVGTTSIIDESVFLGDEFCYQVLGLGAGAVTVSASAVACTTLY